LDSKSQKDGDILFIDTSHVMQAYGDVILEYIFILPTLAKGVMVHMHDIFLPFDYPTHWMFAQKRNYVENWIVGAFLYGNDEWEVVWPTFKMYKEHSEQFKSLPVSDVMHDLQASFWIRKIK